MDRTEKEKGSHRLALLGEELLSRLLKRRNATPKAGTRSLTTWMVPTSLGGLVCASAVSALSGVALLYILNKAAFFAGDQRHILSLILQFVIVILINRFAQRITLKQASGAVEEALHRWRLRINQKVAQCSLRDLEALSRERILDGLARNYQQLSQTLVTLAAAFEAWLSLIAMLVYLFFVSWVAGVLTCVVAAAAVVSFLSIARLMQVALADTAASEIRFSRLAASLTDGFKELRLDPAKRDAIQAELAHASSQLTEARSTASDLRGRVITSANSSANLLPAAVVFLVPLLHYTGRADVSVIVTAVLFLLGPIGGVVRGAVEMPTAQFAARAITAFEAEIDGLPRTDDASEGRAVTFDELVLSNIDYMHGTDEPDARGFAITGIDMTLTRGQIVFVTGANGSGKTTFLRVLTGLYQAQAGSIRVDGLSVSEGPPQTYRNLFSAVFADFHLFSRPYGLDWEAIQRAEETLIDLGIRNKLPADLSAGYDPEHLSTGQRKRLALALALAENRPILVLDEWAADQDPKTRERFYTDILPALRRGGRTIVAVTHDDRYFDCADVRFHMTDGHLHRVDPGSIQ